MDLEKNVDDKLQTKELPEIKLVEDSKVTKQRFSPFYRQILASSGPIMATISAGMVVGYSAILIPELKKPHSQIKISSEHESWIASAAPLPMAVGCLLGGILMEKFGRKMTMLILNVLFVTGWVLISNSTSLVPLLSGRFITGLCVGLLGPPAPIYIGETSDPKYRGLLLSTVSLAVSFGILLAHLFGIYFKWQMSAVICGTFPFVSYILVSLVPESPSWLLKQNRIEEAINAFKWLRGHDVETFNEFSKMLEAQQNSKSDNGQNQSEQTFIEKIKSKAFYKPMIILLVYFGTLQLCGSNAVAFYTVTILKNLLSNNVNEYTATIVIDTVRLGTSFMACAIIKKIGRKPLTTISGIATALCLFGLSLHMYLAASNEYVRSLSAIPLTLMAGYIFFLFIGLSPLAWCLVGELLPLRFRASGSAIATFCNFFYFFIVVKTSPALFKSLGEQGVFLLYGIFCLVGTIYLIIAQPETKDKSLQEIENNYNGTDHKSES